MTNSLINWSFQECYLFAILGICLFANTSFIAMYLLLVKTEWVFRAGAKKNITIFAYAVREFWPGSILLADQLQDIILISLKMVMDSSKNGRWIIPFEKFSLWRVKIKIIVVCVTVWYCNIGHLELLSHSAILDSIIIEFYSKQFCFESC